MFIFKTLFSTTVFLIVAVVTAPGCDNKPEKIESTIVSGITRVLMHERGHFTFLVQHKNHKKLGQLEAKVSASNVKIFEDLRDDETIRVEYFCPSRNCKPVPVSFSIWSIKPSLLIIHIHSEKEINGAGWNHGKSGSGSTVVIE